MAKLTALGRVHIAFLQTCAQQPMKTHKSDMPADELQQMVDEGLLIKYNRAGGPEYNVTSVGSQIARSYGPSPEIKKLSIDYIKSKGYNDEEAEHILKEQGHEVILKTQAAEMRGGTGQKEVTVPTNENGTPEIKFRKS